MCEIARGKFYWGEIRTAIWETAPQIASREKLLKGGERIVYIWFWLGRVQLTCNQTHIFFVERFLRSLKLSHQITKSLSRILVLSRCEESKIELRRSRISNYVKTSLTSFPRAQSTSFLLSTTRPLQGDIWRSTTAPTLLWFRSLQGTEGSTYIL